jgi:CRISPR system Cascade subunit CasD
MDSIKSSGSKGDTVISQRYYVADADYLVGLEGALAELQPLDEALKNPCWQLYFGRKSFVPSCPLQAGISDLPLDEALQRYPYQPKRQRNAPKQLRYVWEVRDSLDVRQDVPLNWQKRLFGSRCVETQFHDVEVADACISRS